MKQIAFVIAAIAVLIVMSAFMPDETEAARAVAAQVHDADREDAAFDVANDWSPK